MSLHRILRRLSFTAVFASVSVAGLSGCEPPPVWSTQDRRQNQRSGRVEGQVVVTGQARGNVILFLFDAIRPPPPRGAGRPVSFTVVPAETLFGPARNDPTRGGPFTAPFAFSLVPAGEYIVQGFLDRDGCLGATGGCRPPDFIPWYSVTSEPNAGDVGGAAVDVLTGTPSIVRVSDDSEVARLATPVHVSFASTATVPVDRPAFQVKSGDGVLRAEGAILNLETLPIDEGVVHQTAPVFLARYVDEDGNGIPDDANADGVPDLWPKVIVRKLADDGPALRDENDANNDGILDVDGVDYPREDGSLDGRPDRVVLAAGLDATQLLPLLTNEQGQPRMDSVPVTQLRVVIRPVAFDASDPLSPVRLQRPPAGRYAVILLQHTGQTWRLPNELQPGMGGERGLPVLESQGFTVLVP